MDGIHLHEPPRPLSDAKVGERVIVEHVIFDFTRARLSAYGIAEGVALRCVATTDHEIRVEPDGGGEVAIDPFLARFVGVSPAPLAEVSARYAS
jgi:hypothetical protein